MSKNSFLFKTPDPIIAFVLQKYKYHKLGKIEELFNFVIEYDTEKELEEIMKDVKYSMDQTNKSDK